MGSLPLAAGRYRPARLVAGMTRPLRLLRRGLRVVCHREVVEDDEADARVVRSREHRRVLPYGGRRPELPGDPAVAVRAVRAMPEPITPTMKPRRVRPGLTAPWRSCRVCQPGGRQQKAPGMLRASISPWVHPNGIPAPLAADQVAPKVIRDGRPRRPGCQGAPGHARGDRSAGAAAAAGPLASGHMRPSILTSLWPQRNVGSPGSTGAAGRGAMPGQRPCDGGGHGASPHR